jgi:creatinine amidohydrolase
MENVVPKTPSNWIHELSFAEVEEHLKKDAIALLPIGATEQHGHHAPLMLDTAWAISVAEEAARLTGVLIAPPLHYGWSYSHMDFSGTLTLRSDTLTRAVIDICESLIYHGFQKIIIINGNRTVVAPFDIAAARLRNATGALVAVADCGLIAQQEVKAISEGGRGTLGHAGESETSMILYTFPHFTDMEKAVDGIKNNAPEKKTNEPELHRGHVNVDPELRGNSVFVPILPSELRRRTADTAGVRGAATLATPKKGEKMVKAIATNLAAFIEEIRPLQVSISRPDVPV